MQPRHAPPAETFGQVVRRLADAQQPPLPLAHLAEQANIHPITLYELVAGRSTPTLLMARSLARVLGVGLAVFDGCDVPPRGGWKEKPENAKNRS